MVFTLSSLDQLTEREAELLCPIMQQISAVGQKSPLLHRHVAPHLFHPLLVRMGCDSGQTNPPSLQLDKEQHVIGNQAFERKHFHREEIRSHQNIHMSADEILPAGRVFSFGGMPYRLPA